MDSRQQAYEQAKQKMIALAAEQTYAELVRQITSRAMDDDWAECLETAAEQVVQKVQSQAAEWRRQQG